MNYVTTDDPLQRCTPCITLHIPASASTGGLKVQLCAVSRLFLRVALVWTLSMQVERSRTLEGCSMTIRCFMNGNQPFGVYSRKEYIGGIVQNDALGPSRDSLEYRY